ncbi:hypothetical protein LXL04_020220 [Taraxacum kok-saghyz]
MFEPGLRELGGIYDMSCLARPRYGILVTEMKIYVDIIGLDTWHHSTILLAFPRIVDDVGTEDETFVEDEGMQSEFLNSLIISDGGIVIQKKEERDCRRWKIANTKHNICPKRDKKSSSLPAIDFFNGSDDFFDTPTILINALTNPPQYTVDYCCEPRRKLVLLH